jgi:2-polyprenyl-3-methyl-5-hydroxy-6-metoxy-1,4-benzoquinol methylase
MEGSPVYLGSDYNVGSTRIHKLTQTQKDLRDRIVSADSRDDYEEVPCLCGAAGPDTVLAAVERHGLPCRNLICMHCGLIRISPRWKEDRYQRFYETEYRDLYNPITTSKEEFARKTAAYPWIRGIAVWIQSSLSRHSQAAGKVHILEIGAGGGWNISNLPSSWKRTGYDVDEQYLEIGKSVFGLEMKNGLLQEALADVPSADAVLLSHVVEHFQDPIGSLRAIARNLRPGSLLLIEVPGIFRLHWSALDPMTFLQNAHVYTFCAKTLESVCVAAGLTVLEKDETCRVVCIKSGVPAPVEPDPKMAERILRYYRACELGTTVRRRLRKLPLIGRVPAYLWKKVFFPCLKLLLPEKA